MGGQICACDDRCGVAHPPLEPLSVDPLAEGDLQGDLRFPAATRASAGASFPGVQVRSMEDQQMDPSMTPIGRMLGETPAGDQGAGPANSWRPGGAVPAAAPTRFEVTLSKQGTKSFGIAHVPMEDGTDTLMVVKTSDEGPVEIWNAMQRDCGRLERQVMRGDRIVCVGGIVADLHGMRELLRQDSVRFSVERWPETWIIPLEKKSQDDRFGMRTELVFRADGTEELRVTQVSGGLLGEWNQWANVTKRFFETVTPGVEIVQVSDAQGIVNRDSRVMQELLLTCQSCEIMLRRPGPEELECT